ncbi:tRNA pseudouridine(38-40) synthase TruA [Gaetbulibacter sp. M240]|uniref:tRNA pseudouridine(38-40) synthase TruA n=1 Tax=Gaetbulibacter sp. M240 TaxID=3126511 RepID=UPI00374F0484
MRYFLELSYNGKDYHGWQIQPDAISVQEVLENAMSTLLKTKIALVGAGRTDTGVHAQQMYAHFDVDHAIDNQDLVYKLNSFLPKDIAVHNIFEVKPEAHARFDALSRTYLYRIALKKDVFNFDAAYLIKQDLDVDEMNKATKILFEYKDFQCFSKTHTDVKTYICDIMKAEWTRVGHELHFVIQADRFLRNMVRAIVGTLVNVGLHKIEAEDVHRIIASKDRGEAGYSVPAQGLYLTQIDYPESIKI